MYIETENELEELLSRPTDADSRAMAALAGDLIILGVGGKMGPSLARLARRAADQASAKKRIIAVARFTNPQLASQLQSLGIETIACDLLDRDALSRLPNVRNVIFMAARKFGTTGSEYLTWALNTYLPGLVADRFRDSQIAVFSTGNVYPLTPPDQGGALESTSVDPQGEYAQSALGRERMFEYGSAKWGTPVVILRLNYAIDLRYGVLLDIGTAVFQRRSIDLRMGSVNVIWQRDANAMCLLALAHCQSPPLVLNLTGPQTLSVRWIAREFGRHFGIEPLFSTAEMPTALLSNATKAINLLGQPTVTPTQMIAWIAHWIKNRGATLDKPTHFQTRDGKF